MTDSSRRTVRTVLQVALAVLVALPVILDQTGITPDQAPWLAGVVAVAGVIARIMQVPAVDALLEPIGLSKGTPGRHELEQGDAPDGA